MNYLIIIALVVICVALLFTVGCASNHPYRTDTTHHNTPEAVIETAPEYKLGFVEFDDQGWFWGVNEKLNQKKAVEDMIRSETGLGTQNPSAVIMVLFVHGWKNNAAFDNSNVNTFRIVLKQLSGLEQTFSQQEKRSPRKLIGIYAGWRGLSVKSDYFPVPLGKELTFWSRKEAAQRVGGYGAMTELMMDLEALQKSSNDALPKNTAQSKLIIVGHSFGADAVYNALSQIITERFVDTIKQGGQLLKPLGDQVILLNPAFEAARFYDLKQLALSVTDYSPDQRPVLTVFQSRGDWATGDFFPIGQRLGTLFQRYRPGDLQKRSNRQSVGWFAPFITHELQYNTNAAIVPAGATPGSTAKTYALRPLDKLPATLENIASQRRQWQSASSQQTTNVFGNCILISKPGYRPPRNPILVVSVDKKIMKDHDDIGNPVLINFLQEYIPFCDNSPPAAP